MAQQHLYRDENGSEYSILRTSTASITVTAIDGDPKDTFADERNHLMEFTVAVTSTTNDECSQQLRTTAGSGYQQNPDLEEGYFIAEYLIGINRPMRVQHNNAALGRAGLNVKLPVDQFVDAFQALEPFVQDDSKLRFNSLIGRLQAGGHHVTLREIMGRLRIALMTINFERESSQPLQNVLVSIAFRPRSFMSPETSKAWAFVWNRVLVSLGVQLI